jgi:DNA-3-methyladenine glycosylase
MSSIERKALGTVLPRSFYDRDTVLVARELLGKLIIVQRKERKAARIVETEAYISGDPANHAFRGRTKRNQSMFKDPGTLYVYAIHNQNCMNAVTKKGEAVLIRAAEPVENICGRTTGPGVLCRAMGITLDDDGKSLRGGEVSIVDDGCRPTSIVSSPRIGVTKWRNRHLRFFIKDSVFVSKPRNLRVHADRSFMHVAASTSRRKI